MDASLRQHCQRRKAALIAEREPYVTDWRQVSQYLDPTRGRFDEGDSRRTAAKRSRAKIINARATRGLRIMTAGFMGGHTSKARPWFRITVPDPTMAELPQVKVWCDDVAQRIRDVLARSNFYTALPNFYTERHAFGVAAMAALEDDEEVVRFYPFTVGTYAIGLNHRNRVDTFWRCYTMTAKQLKDRFGEANLPQRVKDALKDKPDTTFTVESLIEPNPDAKEGMRGPMARPWRQVDYIPGTDSEPHGYLFHGGHYENPILATRWGAVGDEVYSTSPAIDALGDIKQLQYLEGQKLKLLDKMADPALTAPDFMRGRRASTNPGEVVYVTPLQTAKVEPLYAPNHGALQQVMAEIQAVGERVDQAFMVDLFRMLDFLDDRQRTAYEISERKEEKIAMLGPALESLTDEVLDPVIVRVYSIMERRGLIPEVPDVLDNVPLRIEYTSVMAQAQKAAGTGTIERVFGFAAQLFQATGGTRPEVFDKLDFDQAIDEVHDQQGAPARIVRSDDEVEAIRAGRQQQMQMQQMAAMAPALKQGADALATMGKAKAEEGSALEGMVEAAS